MEEIKYSILIPAYNVEKYIERAVNSVFNQTYKGNIEIIVCNDGSTDGTLNILMNYFNKIKILINQVNNRGVITRNRLIREAKGKYIVWLDADDTLDKDFLTFMDNKLKEDDYDIIACSNNFFNEKGEKIGDYDKGENKYIKQNCIDVFFDTANKFMLWGKIIKRDIMEKILPPDKYEEFDDVFYALPMFYHCKKYASTSRMLYNYYYKTGYWSKTLDENYNMTYDQYDKILSCRIDEYNYNAEFLFKNGLFEKYKKNLLECCDLDMLLFDLIKIENKQERLKALHKLFKYANLMIWFKNEIQPF